MKNRIYFIVLAFLIVLSGVLLIIYYTQDFNEKILLKDILIRGDIDYKYSGDVIQEINIELGELNLNNNGVFSEVYSFPEIIGCLDFKPNSTVVSRRQVRVYLDYISEKNYPVDRNPLEIPVGENITFKIKGKYSPYSNEISLVKLQESVQTLSLYKISKQEQNPFESYYDYYSDYVDCNTLDLNSEPMKVIPIYIIGYSSNN